MGIKDVAIFTNISYGRATEEFTESFPPIRNKLILDEDIYIDKLTRELIKKVPILIEKTKDEAEA